MKTINIAILVCATALMLSSCFTRRSDCNYIVVNKSKFNIGIIINYGEITTVLKPGSIFERYQLIDGGPCHGVADFKLSNLDDITSIKVSAEQTNMIRNRLLKTKNDTILYNAFSVYGFSTSQWTITKELLSIMEKDASLLTEFAAYYAK